MEENKFQQFVIGKLTQIEEDVKEIKTGVKKANERLDLQGKQLAYLDEDAPTREEFDQLDERVTSVENKLTS